MLCKQGLPGLSIFSSEEPVRTLKYETVLAWVSRSRLGEEDSYENYPRKNWGWGVLDLERKPSKDVTASDIYGG